MPVGRISCGIGSDIMRAMRRYSNIRGKMALFPCYDSSLLRLSYSCDECESRRNFFFSSTPRHGEQKKTKATRKTAISKDSPAWKKASVIKKLHWENKELFGGLIETKLERVKRIRQEFKEDVMPIISQNVNNGKEGTDMLKSIESDVDSTGSNSRDLLKSGLLPRSESVRFEHAGTSINKNRNVDGVKDNASVSSSIGRPVVRAHKGAEVKWALRNAPTRMKLIELSPSYPESDALGAEENVVSSRKKTPPKATLSSLTDSPRQQLSLPFYNPERNLRAGDTLDVISSSSQQSELRPMKLSTSDEGHDNRGLAESLIISFSFPYSSSTKTSTMAEGSVECDNSKDNELVFKNESGSTQQREPPLAVASSPKLPSVSKILNATMPEEQAKALKRWEEKMIAQMGEKGFRQYKESILFNGKSLHKNIETHLRGTPADEIVVAQPNQGHWDSLSGVLASIDQVHVLESHVIHPQLEYCGVIDCVAEFRNRLVLIDWKTSQKPKPLVSMTYDTPLQIAAYIGAINYDPRYSLKIDDGLIVVAYEDGSSCQTFLLGAAHVEKYWKLWLKRLQLFRQINPPS